MITPVVRHPDQVTPDWLTSVLRADELLDEASIDSFETISIGAGLMGLCTQFVLRYDLDEPGAPASVIGKFAAVDETARRFMSATGYRNEVAFYRDFARTVDVRSPRCSHAEIDDEGWFTLVLEDLSPARPGDQLRGCTVAEAELAVGELVRLHAPRWGDPSLAGHPCFAGAAGVDPDAFGGVLAATVPGFLERYSSALDAPAIAFYERLGAGVANWLRARPAPCTIVHSDFRPDNLLFGDGEHGPFVAVVDWQGMAHGCGLSDVGFLLGNSLTIEQRRADERRIVASYHGALIAAGVADYGWERCWQEYRVSLLSGLLTTILGAMYGLRTERGDRMFELMAQRHATQILDLGADEFLEAR